MGERALVRLGHGTEEGGTVRWLQHSNFSQMEEETQRQGWRNTWKEI